MGQVELMTMSPVCTFVRPKSFAKSQSFKEHHHRKTQSEDLAEIVESLSKITFTVPAVKEEPEEEQEYMAKCECCGCWKSARRGMSRA